MLSVVVPVYMQHEALSLMLGSLSQQSAGLGAFEIVVVDDGSPEDVGAVVSQFTDHLSLRLERHVTNRGRAAARNTGAKAAAGDRLLFLDSDSVAHPDLIRRHIAAGARDGEVALLGRRVEADWATTAALSGPGEPPLDVSLDQEDERFNDAAHAEALMRDVPWTFAHSHNIAYPRAAFEALGGFDEEFRTWGWEDTELAYRFFRHHDRRPTAFAYDPDAVCYHYPHFVDVRGRWAAGVSTGLQYFKRKHEHFDVERLGVWVRVFALNQGRYATFMNRPDSPQPGQTRYLEDLLPHSPGRLWAGRGSAQLQNSVLAALDVTQPISESNRHLIGLSTLWPDRHFSDVVLWDNWRILTIHDLSACVAEGLRLAPVVYLAGTAELASGLPIAALREVSGALETAAHLRVRRLSGESPVWVFEIRSAA